jgi:hypothetical protein
MLCLPSEKEPVIFNAILFGPVLENVVHAEHLTITYFIALDMYLPNPHEYTYIKESFQV